MLAVPISTPGAKTAHLAAMWPWPALPGVIIALLGSTAFSGQAGPKCGGEFGRISQKGGIDKNGRGTQYRFTILGGSQMAVWQKDSGSTEEPDQS